ncbi:hypothetical protein C9J60_16795 [Streptomyces sp. A244]|uniref:hypothetical protein n=1 Tax=Streptomyces TaxID=1883 RepID=UPI000D19C2F5|nr:hypothetical protein [Streptomyces sp. A244]PTH87483.1 hypothetical protein C9J60_16795 [Streptomyces sp. A244]
MADPQSNARLRADAGAPTTGVIHVRTRLTADFTVISNALAQRRGSAVTIGVAAYIASLPDGSPVTITALCRHFSEGEILISRALRDLEAAGYLERRRERTPTGQVRTRTYFYAVPRGEGPEDPPEPPKPRPRKRSAVPGTRREAASAPAPEEPGSPAPALADADPEAVAVLTALRRVDPRLVLSGQEAARLAPAVTAWLAAGVGPREITELLTVRLPDRFRTRPASVLAFRLRETPLPMPPPAPLPPDVERPVVLPFQTCDGCERAFRAPGPGHCRSCRDRLAGECLRAG